MAIVLVLISHTWATNTPPHLSWLGPLAHQGDLGVRIFFVLSGYLITRLLIEEELRNGAISLGAFYLRRVTRIFPVYLLYLAALALLQFKSLYFQSPSSWAGSLTFTRNIVGQGRDATAHLWSLSVEEQFYLVWPAALTTLGLVNRSRLSLTVLNSIVIIAIVARAVPCEGVSFTCERLLGAKSAIAYADCLAIGCIGAILHAKMSFNDCTRPSLWLNVCAGSLLASIFIAPSNPLERSLLVLLQAFLSMGAIIFSISSSPKFLYRLLNCRPIVYLGVLSYSIYVWHMFFLSYYIGTPLSTTLIYDGNIFWLPSIITAWLSYELFEKRFIAWRKTLELNDPVVNPRAALLRERSHRLPDAEGL
jgi:peptidoglycan/LPS O-acetylase OafA/YrhL